MTVENYKAQREFLASVLEKLDAAIDEKSQTLSGEELDQAFAAEADKEFVHMIDSIKDIMGKRYVANNSEATISPAVLEKAEKQAAEKAQRQAKEQLDKFIGQIEPTVKKLKTHMEQYEKLQSRRNDLKEQLEYIGIKL